MALVAHHSANTEPAAARQIGNPPCLRRRGTTARQPDVDVDQHLIDATIGRSRYGFRRIDCDRDPGTLLDEYAKPPCVEDLVGQQEVGAEPGPCHAFYLADGGAGEVVMAVGILSAGQPGGLVRLDVWAESSTG